MNETTLTPIHVALELSMLQQFDHIEDMADEALQNLDDMVEMMNIRAEYNWLKHQVKTLFPLGPTTFMDLNLVRWFAKVEGMTHLIDALIDELSPQGAGIAHDRRD